MSNVFWGENYSGSLDCQNVVLQCGKWLTLRVLIFHKM